MAIASLFKDYRPMAFFGWLALLFALLGLAAGLPVVWEFVATGLVEKLPSAVLAAALVMRGSLAHGGPHPGHGGEELAARLGGRGVQGDGAVGFALAKKCGGDELTLFPRKNAFLQLLISPPLDFILAKYPGNKRPVRGYFF